MARHVIDAGNRVAVWNRTLEKSRELVDAGAVAAATPAQAATNCDVILMCVTDGAAVERVLFADDGVAAGAKRGAVVVDHSTIHPAQARAFAGRLAQAGIGFVDAPVSGGPAGAQAGTLATFLGGTGEDVARVRPLLAAYAAKITHVGPSGSGQLAKSCNQAVVTATVAIWAEVVNYARAAGLDPAVVVDAVEGGWADSPIRRAFGPTLAAGSVGGTGALFVKDLGFVEDVAREAGVPMPLTHVVAERIRALYGI